VKPLRVALYARLSHEDSTAAIPSCEVQIAHGRDEAEAIGGHVVLERSDDGCSGAEMVKRPGLSAIRSAAEKRTIDVVLVRDLDRLARCEPARMLGLLQTLTDQDVRVRSYSDHAWVSIDDMNCLNTTVRAIVNRQERVKASTRTREKLDEMLRRGIAVRRPPFGFAMAPRVAGQPADYVRVVSEIDALLAMARRFVETDGNRYRTACWMNERGMRTRSGSHWEPAGVRRTLANPFYRGVIEFGRRRVSEQAGTLALVHAREDEVRRTKRADLAVFDSELCRRIDRLLPLRVTTGHGPAAPRNLSSAIVRCGVCGGAVVGNGTRGAYVCERLQKSGRAVCVGIGRRPRHEVDRKSIELVMPLLEGETRKRALTIYRERLEAAASGEDIDSARDRANSVLTDVERAIGNLTKAIRCGGDLEPLLSDLSEQTRRRDALRAEVARLDETRPLRLDVRREVAAAGRRLDRMAEELRGANVEAARGVLRALLGAGGLRATPVEVDGQRRWQLIGRVGSGYVSNVCAKGGT
jgi:site-specific DNA recombinase